MNQEDKCKLSALYSGNKINEIWQSSQDLPVIEHPEFGKISPIVYRSKYHNKPCPFCGKKMVFGKSQHSTKSKEEAINRGYEYKDKNSNSFINFAINQSKKIYFHPHYVTLDHKLNKARIPEKMFDYENLQIMCWKCNMNKGDDNAYELLHTLSYIEDLVQETIQQYPTL